MATGDNLQTASSVAKTSGIFAESQTKIFLGDVNQAGNVVWRNSNDADEFTSDLSWVKEDNSIGLAMTGSAFEVIEGVKDEDPD